MKKKPTTKEMKKTVRSISRMIDPEHITKTRSSLQRLLRDDWELNRRLRDILEDPKK